MRHERGNSGADANLDKVQRWMQAVIVHPGDVEEAIASKDAEREFDAGRLDELVKPSHSLTPAERVDIYHGMYILRMVEALQSDYPALAHFLGEDDFVDVVRDYVQRYPSRSYTLNRLGDHMPAFLLEEPRRENAPFLHDLARFELAVTEAFDEEETAVLKPEAIQDVPQEAWSGARLKPVAAFRLVALKHDVIPQVDASKRDYPAPKPRRRATWVAVYRRDYSVYHLSMSRAEYGLLESLAGGSPLGEAVAVAASKLKASESPQKIFKWFRTWIAEGMFSAVTFE